MTKPVKELADMLGITPENLRQKLMKPDAPQPQLRVKGSRIVKYYDQHEIVEWFRLL